MHFLCVGHLIKHPVFLRLEQSERVRVHFLRFVSLAKTLVNTDTTFFVGSVVDHSLRDKRLYTDKNAMLLYELVEHPMYERFFTYIFSRRSCVHHSITKIHLPWILHRQAGSCHFWSDRKRSHPNLTIRKSLAQLWIALVVLHLSWLLWHALYKCSDTITVRAPQIFSPL